MRLDRTLRNGAGKYALIKVRAITACDQKDRHAIDEALALLDRLGILDLGDAPETEFFVIRLKDKYAGGALFTYAGYALSDGEIEYGQDVMSLAKRAGSNSPLCKKPD